MKNAYRVRSIFLTLFLTTLILGCSDSTDVASNVTAPVEGEPVAVESAEVGASTTNQTEPMVSALDKNKAVVRRYKELQFSATESELLAANHQTLRAEFQNLAVNAQDPALSALTEPMTVAIPDRVEQIEEIIAEGDLVGIQTRITGTHSGNLYGIPATGKPFDIVATAFYKVIDGKITESWEMADEAGLLRQLGQPLPKRSDGTRVAPTINYPTRLGSEVLADIMANPQDTDTYINKERVSAYKSEVRPPHQVFDGRPYENYLRRGFFHVGDRASQLGIDGPGIGQAVPDRVDRVGVLIAEGNKVMIQFLLTGTNTVSLFGIPPSNNPVGAWEVGVHTFEGTIWKDGWWFGDDLGMLLQIGAPDDYLLSSE